MGGVKWYNDEEYIEHDGEEVIYTVFGKIMYDDFWVLVERHSTYNITIETYQPTPEPLTVMRVRVKV